RSSSAHSRASGNPGPNTPAAIGLWVPACAGTSGLVLPPPLPLLVLRTHEHGRALHRVGEPAVPPLSEITRDRFARIDETQMDRGKIATHRAQHLLVDQLERMRLGIELAVVRRMTAHDHVA